MRNPSLAVVIAGVSLSLLLVGCGDQNAMETDQQVGPNPALPEASNFLLPPMQVPRGVGWQRDTLPKVADGLKIEKIAEDLLHPR